MSKVPKVNGYMESVNLMPSSEDFVAVPNLYVSELYSFYQDCKDMEQVLEKTADFFRKGNGICGRHGGKGRTGKSTGKKSSWL